MKHSRFVEYWRRKGVNSYAWYVHHARKTENWRELQLLRQQQEAEAISYRRAYIELGAIAAALITAVIAGLVWLLS